VVLGAGAPHSGQTPPSLINAPGKERVLDLNLRVLNFFGLSDVSFVSGHRAQDVKNLYGSTIDIAQNSDWADGGTLSSLALVDTRNYSELVVLYADVLFREKSFGDLLEGNEDVVFAIDRKGNQHREKASGSGLVPNEQVGFNSAGSFSFGTDIRPAHFAGEFVGIVKLSGRALDNLRKLLTEDGPIASGVVGNLGDFLNLCVENCLSFQAVDFAGNWTEVTEPDDVARFILRSKAETLETLKPLLTKSKIQPLLKVFWKTWSANRVVDIEKICSSFPDTRLIVRSSASDEDGFDQSGAGKNATVMDVLGDDSIGEHIDQVFKSYETLRPDDHVLIQPLVVDVVESGVCLSRSLSDGDPWYTINFSSDGTTDSVTHGYSLDGRASYTYRDAVKKDWIRAPHIALLAAMQEIESILHYDSIDVEYAIDAEGRVNIFQVRPLVGKKREICAVDEAAYAIRDKAVAQWREISAQKIFGEDFPLVLGVMSDWNPAEIIGAQPGLLSFTLYKYLVTDETWSLQRSQFGYQDLRGNLLMHSIGGRPFIDVRQSLASFIPSDLSPELKQKLLRVYIQDLVNYPHKHDKIEFEVAPTCFDFEWPEWEKRLRDSKTIDVQEVRQLGLSLKKITKDAFVRLDEAEQTMGGLSGELAALSRQEGKFRLRRQLEAVKRKGALPFAHLARCGFIAIALLRSAEAKGLLSPAGKNAFFGSLGTVSREFTEDAFHVTAGEMPFSNFVAKYGHLRPGTYEIVSPRYDQDPETFLRPIVNQARKSDDASAARQIWNQEKGDFLGGLESLGLFESASGAEDFLVRSVSGRERGKFLFSLGISTILEEIASEAERHGLSRRQASDMSLDAVTKLAGAKLSSSGHGEKYVLDPPGSAVPVEPARISLPPLISSEKDFYHFSELGDIPNYFGETQTWGEVLCLDGHDYSSKTEVSGKIILLERADPGFDWLFGYEIAGLVTKYGGANSHMSIRVSEFGLPAAIGVGETMYRQLLDAKVAELSPRMRIVRKLS